MIRYQILGSIMAVVMMVNFLIKLDLSAPEKNENENENEETLALNQTIGSLPKSSSNRKPAAQKNISILKENNKREEPETSSNSFAGDNNSESFDDGATNNNVGIGNSGTPGGARAPLARTNLPLDNLGLPDLKKVLAKPADEKKLIVPSNEIIKNKKEDKKIAAKLPEDESRITSTSVNANAPAANTCDANITGGSFSSPISVQLSCANISTIKYCLALDTGSGCCDPHIGGLTYSSSIVVGSSDGNYCLSFYGESNFAGISLDYENSYVINSSLPNLQVNHPQIYYQTTQLAGKSTIDSSDFGRTGFSLGQINLGSHDPGPSALNLDCDQIINNTTFLTAPVPLSVFSLLDLSLEIPATPIVIPLRYEHLVYGDNFITSFIADNNFVTPIYACSTAKVVLFDFDFFPEELNSGDVGDNTVREFTGGFSPYGFFEDESTFPIARAPAGVNTEDNTGQKLQSGMFGIFY